MTNQIKEVGLKRVFEGNDAKLEECVRELNVICDTIQQILNNEKLVCRALTPEELEKQKYTIYMLECICNSLNTAIEDTDRLSLKDNDGTIFN